MPPRIPQKQIQRHRPCGIHNEGAWKGGDVEIVEERLGTARGGVVEGELSLPVVDEPLDHVVSLGGDGEDVDSALVLLRYLGHVWDRLDARRAPCGPNLEHVRLSG